MDGVIFVSIIIIRLPGTPILRNDQGTQYATLKKEMEKELKKLPDYQVL
jgi:hypothetical protein